MPVEESYYKLVLHCDVKATNSPMWSGENTFYGNNLGKAKKAARKAGWKFKNNGIVLCPDCAQEEAKKRKKKKNKKGK